MKYYLIKCKKCGNKMKYMTDSAVTELSKKVKKCVYCGFNIKVSKGLIKQVER